MERRPDIAQALADRLGMDPAQADAVMAGDFSPLILNRISDPLLAAVACSMLERSRDDAPAQPSRTEIEQRLARATSAVRDLKAQLAAAMAMLRFVGDLFGACPACWGEDSQCAACRGRGGPGFHPVDRDRLLAKLEPVLERLNLRVAPASPSREAGVSA